MSATFLTYGIIASDESVEERTCMLVRRFGLSARMILIAVSLSIVLFLLSGRVAKRGALSFKVGPENERRTLTVNRQAQRGPTRGNLRIEAGKRVGELQIGDTRQRAFEVFPQKLNVDQISENSNCGVEYLWVDMENSGKGNVIIRFRDNMVFQIESAATRYHLETGIRVGASPEEVRKNHVGLRAFFLEGIFSEAIGGRPLIFWVDEGKGIAFGFAHAPDKRSRYLNKIVVFAPGGGFCPEGEAPNPQLWHELKPYSIELPQANQPR